MTTTSDTLTPTVESVCDAVSLVRETAGVAVPAAYRDDRGAIGAVVPRGRVGVGRGCALDGSRECDRDVGGAPARRRGEESKAHAEQFLVEHARTCEPCVVGRFASRIEAHLDPDGVLTTEEEQRAAQELHLRKDQHGMWRLSGRFDAENAAAIQAFLSLLAKPKEQPDGSRDPRPAALRRAEALMTIVRWSLDADQQPTSGGDRPHITVTVTFGRARGAVTGPVDHRGCHLRWRRSVGCSATRSPPPPSSPPSGRSSTRGRDLRLVTEAQRKALIARDKGCAFPGCDAPPWFCHAHHIRYWEDGGPTDITNLTLLCRRHHLLVHKADSHWQIIMIRGIPTPSPPHGSTRHRHRNATPPTTHRERRPATRWTAT